MRTRTFIGLTAAAGAAAAGYAALIERNWFVLRRYEVPVLPSGAAPVRVLHISDTHLTPRRGKMMSWIRALDALDPHLVVNTGDSIAHPQAVPSLLNALGPLLDRPGVFVLGSNDLYSPRPRNPARYLYRKNHGKDERGAPTLPWEKLRDGMTEAGWLDLDNQRGRLRAGGLDIALAGVHDSHVARDRYSDVAGRADPAADLRIGVMHSPEPRLLDLFAADGYDLLLAGHTHGGQLCLPRFGTLVTNCGLDRKLARGLHRYPTARCSGDARRTEDGQNGTAGGDGRNDIGGGDSNRAEAGGGDLDGRAWLHVSAGLGTSPWAPARFACRPEATLLTLTPR
ncbi:MAG TPA: metallophosphoesterase [Streptosporangiaceae bacterium]